METERQSSKRARALLREQASAAVTLHEWFLMSVPAFVAAAAALLCLVTEELLTQVHSGKEPEIPVSTLVLFGGFLAFSCVQLAGARQGRARSALAPNCSVDGPPDRRHHPRMARPKPAAPPPPAPGYFVSEFIGLPVLDVSREPVGKIRDLLVETGSKSPFPRVTGLLLREGFESFVLPWDDVAIFVHGSVRTRLSRADVIHRAPEEDEILLARHLLDKQIVDISGAKVVRVNDLKLDFVEGDLVLTAADVGIRGIMRRVFGVGVTPRGGPWSDASLPPRLIPWDSMQPIHPKLDRLQTTLPAEKLRRLHPADIAELIAQVSAKEGVEVFRKLDVETAAQTLHELEPELQVDLIEELPKEQASDILEQMPADEAADILGDLKGSEARELVEGMEKDAAEEVSELLVHDEDTAGGMMGTEYIAFPPSTTVAEAFGRLRAAAHDAELITDVFVVGEREELLGAMSVRDLLAAEDGVALEQVMHVPARSVRADVPVKEVIDLMAKYDLLELPVTGPDGALVGTVAIEDVVGFLYPEGRARRRRLR